MATKEKNDRLAGGVMRMNNRPQSEQVRPKVTVQTGLNLMSQIDYEHETACEFSRGFLGGVD